MKLPAAVVGALALGASLVQAQYFSAGWQPGQAVPTPSASASAGFDPAAQTAQAAQTPGAASPGLGGIFERLMTSPPIANLFNKAGVNITERLAAAHQAQADLWDTRIPFITDDNWQELIVNETFASADEERDRVWFLIITAAMAQNDAMSRFSDKHFDATYNLSLVENDIPHVKFGRVDYLNVTYLTTKWAVWSAPYFVVATDRGQTLRFYRASQLRLEPETLHRFLLTGAYDQTEPWSSSFAPGGSNEYLIDYFSAFSEKAYNYTLLIPRWAFIAITGMFGSVVLQLFHRKPAAPAAKPKPAPRATPAKAASGSAQAQASGAQASPSAQKAAASPAKGRKKAAKK